MGRLCWFLFSVYDASLDVRLRNCGSSCASNILMLGLNSAFYKGHAIWMSVNADPTNINPINFYICDLKSGAPCYFIDKDGKVCSVDRSKEFLHNGVDHLPIKDVIKAFKGE